MPGRRAREAMPGRNVMLESTSGTCALELETGTNHFLVAARVEFGTEFPKWFIFYLRGSQHSSVQHLTSSCEGFEV